MSTCPAVSVIMNCFNSAQYLKEAIESVYAQTWQDWEIIFWDNASTDESPQIANSFDERLRYFRSETTYPLGKARNYAVAEARGQYVTFLDCDDMWLPGKLEQQISLLEGHPDCDFVYANYYSYNMDLGTKNLAYSTPQPEGSVFGKFLQRYPVGMLTVMIRQSALARLGSLFDPDLRLAEEFELFMRLLYQSKAVYLAEPVAVYRVHQNMCSYLLRDGWNDEFRFCLQRFRLLDTEGRYPAELATMEWKISYNEALLLFVRGELAGARRVIAPIKFKGIKVFGVYVVSFLPKKLLAVLSPIWRKHVYFR